MKIKEMLGFCACKNCKNRYMITLTVSCFDKQSKIIEKKMRVCEKHAEKILVGRR